MIAVLQYVRSGSGKVFRSPVLYLLLRVLYRTVQCLSFDQLREPKVTAGQIGCS